VDILPDSAIINEIGIFYWKNGDIFEGNFKDGQASGKGTYTYISGATYIGEYIRDKKHGKGEQDPNQPYLFRMLYLAQWRQVRGRIHSRFNYRKR